MKTNLVKIQGTTPVAQQVVTVEFEDVFYGGGLQTGRRRNLARIKVDASRYNLRIRPGGGALGVPQFQAVWSGYIPGGGSTAQLPAAGGPDVMLTPELTGCAIVARNNPDGSADFSHYNLVNNGATLPQDQMEGIAQAQYGGGQTVVSKEQYRAGFANALQVCCSCVGFRRNGRWEFWGQIQESKNSGLQLRELRRLA